MSETALATRRTGGIEVYHSWTPEALQEAIDREKQLREIVIQYYRDSMIDGHHYYSLDEDGRQGGRRTGKKAEDRPKRKPALSKEGALNLCSLFKVKPVMDIPAETYSPDGHYTVRYRANLVSLTSGEIVASGDGLCSTRESKYAYRWVYERDIPSDVDKATLVYVERKSDQGGTYRRYKLPNADLADQYNTTLKMSEKRAIVDAVLKLPLASELFTQDLDEAIEARRQARQAPSAGATTTAPTEEPPSEEMGQDVEQRALLLQAITATFKEYAPGSSKEDRAKRLQLMQKAFGVDGWQRISGLSTDAMQAGYEHLQAILTADIPDDDLPDNGPGVPVADSAILTDVGEDDRATTRERMATAEEFKALHSLALQVSPEAEQAVLDLMAKWPDGMPARLVEQHYAALKAALAEEG